MSRVLEGLEPSIVWEIFEDISRIPRCTWKEERLQDWLVEWAERYEVDCKRDEHGNILFTREASMGCEHYSALILQAHQDMVCEKTPECTHDFDVDPIPLVVKGEIVTADGTSLGADNAVGAALGMALIIDRELDKHGKIEVLLTPGEEGGSMGARYTKDFFTSRRMINLDSEEVGVIIIGSAGGGGTTYVWPSAFEAANSGVGFKLEVGGLLGGHSGVDIHLPRLNANKVLASGLKQVLNVTSLRIMHIDGGSRGNAIARDAHCVFVVPEDKSDEVKRVISEWDRGLDRSIEKDLTIKVGEVEVPEALSEELSSNIIGLINDVQQGPFSWREDIPDIVQTSNNLGVLRVEEGSIKIPLGSRTSNLKDLEKNQTILRELGERYRATVEQRKGSAGWMSDPDNRFLKLVESKYSKVLGKSAKVTAIHAGLECGIFGGFFKDIEIVSIGPEIKYPHSPQEYVEIASVGVLWDVLRAIARNMDGE